MSSHRRQAAIAGLLLATVAGLAAAPAAAQALATVHVDDVRVRGSGHHRVLLSVVDRSGTPVPGLEGAFRVEVDGGGTPGEAGAVQPVARAGRTARPTATVTVVVDAALLRGESVNGVRDAVKALGAGLVHADRVRVAAVAARTRVREAAADELGGLADALASSGADETPELYAALFDAVRAASRLPSNRDGVLLVVTRGADATGGAGSGALDVVAMARARGRLASVFVVIVGDPAGAREADGLRRIAEHTGGAFTSVASAADLPGTLPALLDRGLHRWVLEFDAPGWDRSKPRHRLHIAVEKDGERRWTDADYDTADALPDPWWRSPLPWLMLAAVVVLGAVAALAGRRRQLGLLVHDGDDDDGVWYEVFGYPLTLGAAAGNDVRFVESQVSRNHAVLERRGRVVELADLNSENGTFVNGERITRRVLADGDRVSLGPAVHLVYEARG